MDGRPTTHTKFHLRPRSNGRASPRPKPEWLTRTVLHEARSYLDATDAIELARRCQRIHLEAGTVLYSPDLPPRYALLIDSGCVEVTERSGNQRRVLDLLGGGQVTGDIYLLLHRTPVVTAGCSEHTSGWAIADEDFRELLESNPRLAHAWLCNVAARLAEKRAQVVQLVGHSLRSRLATLIGSQAVDDVLRAPQRTLANMLGVQRTSVNRNLKQLESEGLIKLRYGKIVVVDRVGLARVADEPESGEA